MRIPFVPKLGCTEPSQPRASLESESCTHLSKKGSEEASMPTRGRRRILNGTEDVSLQAGE